MSEDPTRGGKGRPDPDEDRYHTGREVWFVAGELREEAPSTGDRRRVALALP